jgi:hypothetical protein
MGLDETCVALGFSVNPGLAPVFEGGTDGFTGAFADDFTGAAPAFVGAGLTLVVFAGAALVFVLAYRVISRS